MIKKLFAALSGALLLAGVATAPALAQQAPQNIPGAANQGGSTDANGAPTTQSDASRLNRNRAPEERRNRRERAPAAPTPEEIKIAAQAAATTTNSPCQVTEATLLGDATGGGKVYEAACATGPGYIFTASATPNAIDCVMLEYTLNRRTEQAAPAAPAGATGAAEAPAAAAPPAETKVGGCKIPANLDTQAVMKAYAVEAGVPCPVDQAVVVGASNTNAVVYEVGCPSVDGYRISKEAAGWTKTPCIEVVSAGGACQFTTKAEQSATMKTWFAGNAEAAACDVTDGRYMGANTNGSFYEAKCGAGNGLIVRFDTAMAIQQVYPCETAQRVGGGCKLTVVPDAPAAAPAPAAEPTTQE